MLNLLLYFAVFAIAFYILIKAADIFVDEAALVGRAFGLSNLMIGLTIVAIGTSLPELITSLGSIIFTDNFSDFIIGTTLGSNTTNILLAFGIFLLFAGKFSIKKKETFNIAALLLTSIVFSVFILLGFVNYFALVLLAFYIGYLVYLAKYQRETILLEEKELTNKKTKPKDVGVKTYLLLFASFISLFVGAKLVIFSIENIGLILAIPAAYLSLTTISVATSLPEIAVTVSSARKKEYLIGIGNIIGTNVMNVCLIIGFSGFMGWYALDTSLYLYSLGFFAIGTLIFSYLVTRKKFSPFFGQTFLLLYILYLGSFFI